jgi:hypothetical protein
VVRGTPLVSEGGGGSVSIGPSTHRRFHGDSENGTRISQMGPATTKIGPINLQWDSNFPKGTHIAQMGPYLGAGTLFLPEGYSGSFRCDLKGDGGRSDTTARRGPSLGE